MCLNKALFNNAGKNLANSKIFRAPISSLPLPFKSSIDYYGKNGRIQCAESDKGKINGSFFG